MSERPTRILISGPRSWENDKPIRKLLLRLIDIYGQEGFLVIVGGAGGVDKLTYHACWDLGIHCAEIRALWPHFNHSAGPKRNRMMLSLEPDRVIALHWDINESKGTLDCLNQAQELGIPTRLIIIKKVIACPSVKWWRERQAERRKK